MDNIVFERDYRRPANAEPANDWSSRVLDRAVEAGVLQNYAKALDEIPKIIVPQDKENYEYLLQCCEALAKRLHGHIKGEVDYQRWDAHIDLLLPFIEFGNDEERLMLKEIAEKAHLITFAPAEDGGIRLSLMVNYFEELATEEYKSYLRYDAIMDDPELAEMLSMPKLSPEEEAKVQRLKDILDRFENETDYDRTTVFKAIYGYMSKVELDDWSVEQMIAYAEKLLRKILNKEDSSDIEDHG